MQPVKLHKYLLHKYLFIGFSFLEIYLANCNPHHAINYNFRKKHKTSWLVAVLKSPCRVRRTVIHSQYQCQRPKTSQQRNASNSVARNTYIVWPIPGFTSLSRSAEVVAMKASNCSWGILIFTSLLCLFFRRAAQHVSSFQMANIAQSPHIPSRSDCRPSTARLISGDNLPDSRKHRWVELVERDDFEEWGLEKNDKAKGSAPMTATSVVNESFDAIAGTLYDQQKLDPAIASNAYSRAIFDDRPLRSTSSAGRIGIEIDGAQHLFPDVHRLSRNRATRRVALMLAAKMASSSSWSTYEKGSSITDFRPIVMCFSTLNEALLASREMQSLLRACSSTRQRKAFDHVVIQSLSDDLPKILLSESEKKYRHLSKLRVSPLRGLVLVVQPTDFNAESTPPAPSLHTLTNFQRMVACAYLQQIPVVALSPRFSTDARNDPSDCNAGNQNSFQRAGYYGGQEPPKSPSPWVLRDFFPPSYCWVTTSHSIEGLNEDKSSRRSVCLVTLTNSVMHEVINPAYT